MKPRKSKREVARDDCIRKTQNESQPRCQAPHRVTNAFFRANEERRSRRAKDYRDIQIKTDFCKSEFLIKKTNKIKCGLL